MKNKKENSGKNMMIYSRKILIINLKALKLIKEDLLILISKNLKKNIKHTYDNS
jgi:hypothetical protein